MRPLGLQGRNRLGQAATGPDQLESLLKRAAHVDEVARAVQARAGRARTGLGEREGLRVRATEMAELGRVGQVRAGPGELQGLGMRAAHPAERARAGQVRTRRDQLQGLRIRSTHREQQRHAVHVHARSDQLEDLLMGAALLAQRRSPVQVRAGRDQLECLRMCAARMAEPARADQAHPGRGKLEGLLMSAAHLAEPVRVASAHADRFQLARLLRFRQRRTPSCPRLRPPSSASRSVPPQPDPSRSSMSPGELESTAASEGNTAPAVDDQGRRDDQPWTGLGWRGRTLPANEALVVRVKPVLDVALADRGDQDPAAGAFVSAIVAVAMGVQLALHGRRQVVPPCDG